MDQNKTLELLKKKIQEIDELSIEVDREKLRQWREETLMVLDALIDQSSKYYVNFEDISYQSSVVNIGNQALNKQRDDEAYKSGLAKAKSSLNAIVFGLEQGLF